MRIRLGLQARFLGMMALAMLVVLGLTVVLLHRQTQMQDEVEQASRLAIDGTVSGVLYRQGKGEVMQLAESLANPLYYLDLDAIGAIGRATLRNPDVRYLMVYDAAGNIVHDGSAAIAGYGRRMDDPMAARVIASRSLLMLLDGSVMDVSMPIRMGREPIGGVRVGYDLQVSRRVQEQAIGSLRARLDELGRSHLFGVVLLGAVLIGLGAAMLWLTRISLVLPIRRLAESARAIEEGRFEPLPLPEARNDELGDLMRAFGRMSDSLARHDRDIRRMAYTDALTGLANRLAFRERLDVQLERLRGTGRQLALLFADIDDFKRINDTYGHDAGDEALLQCAQRIQGTVERLCGPDALLARFGGDEFVILMQDDPTVEGGIRALASALAEALVAEIGRPVLISQREIFLGTSIGITLFPEDAVNATLLIKNGDIAMYQAKVAGKNCFRFYSRAMDQAVERRVHLEQDLHGAWDRGELSLVYQPVFRVGDNAMVGAEALLRWQHPERGSIAPSVFIDVAEQSGLIASLGPQVLRAACEDAASWQHLRAREEPLFVAVNVSPRQLRSGDLPEVVAGCLREAGLPADRLHLELTETAVIGDELHASHLLSRLRTMGVKVWLDDFGTGFSGLSHLRRVPVDGVKIDRSFVADILRDPDDLALTTAIIAMAHSLGMIVVAEGVEKEGQYEILRERGCNLAQGYWLGHPLPAEEFLRLVE